MPHNIEDPVREALLFLHRHLQDCSAHLGELECNDTDIRALIKAVSSFSEFASDLVTELSLLVPTQQSVSFGSSRLGFRTQD